MRYWTECREFFRQFRNQYFTTGSILPSSRALGRALVREIFADYERLLKPEGVLSYFEYLGIRNLKMLLVGKKERRRLHVLTRMLERRIRTYQIGEERVFFNVPPAVARHFCFNESKV